jgi:hypothetical protein
VAPLIDFIIEVWQRNKLRRFQDLAHDIGRLAILKWKHWVILHWWSASYYLCASTRPFNYMVYGLAKLAMCTNYHKKNIFFYYFFFRGKCPPWYTFLTRFSNETWFLNYRFWHALWHPGCRLNGITPITLQQTELFLWYLRYVLYACRACFLSKLGAIQFMVWPPGGALWKQKIVHYSINNDRIVTKFLWWALLTMIHNISYEFFIWWTFLPYSGRFMEFM